MLDQHVIAYHDEIDVMLSPNFLDVIKQVVNVGEVLAAISLRLKDALARSIQAQHREIVCFAQPWAVSVEHALLIDNLSFSMVEQHIALVPNQVL